MASRDQLPEEADGIISLARDCIEGSLPAVMSVRARKFGGQAEGQGGRQGKTASTCVRRSRPRTSRIRARLESLPMLGQPKLASFATPPRLQGSVARGFVCEPPGNATDERTVQERTLFFQILLEFCGIFRAAQLRDAISRAIGNLPRYTIIGSDRASKQIERDGGAAKATPKVNLYSLFSREKCT